MAQGGYKRNLKILTPYIDNLLDFWDNKIVYGALLGFE